MPACRRHARLRAAQRSGPVAFIMSSNDRRRHMKLGQRAMIAAKVRSILNIPYDKAAAIVERVSKQYVSHASIVLRYAPDLIDAV